MKKNILWFGILWISLCYSCDKNGEKQANKQSNSRIKFEKTRHDFGEVEKTDSSLSYDFKFKNIGSEAVLIKDVKTSCTCTTPEWTKGTILPGDVGFIRAQYNTKGDSGTFVKAVDVIFNTKADSVVSLWMFGNIIQKPRN